MGADASKASRQLPVLRWPISTSRSSPRPPSGSIWMPTSPVARLQPRLLILDPFVRLHRIDENASGEVAPLLAYRARRSRHQNGYV